MNRTQSELRIEPPRETLDAARAWLAPVREALGSEFIAAFLNGSVLREGFDPKGSKINVTVVAGNLELEVLGRVREAMPVPRKAPYFELLLLTQRQIANSLDSFPIEWREMRERHLTLEGQDLLAGLEVADSHLRLQCEHELRARHIRLRQAYLASGRKPLALTDVLKSSASSFATLFRTLLRLRGETPPASAPEVIEKVAQLYRLDAESLLGAHRVRHSARKYKAEELLAVYRKFLTEIDRLVIAIDTLRVP